MIRCCRSLARVRLKTERWMAAFDPKRPVGSARPTVTKARYSRTCAGDHRSTGRRILAGTRKQVDPSCSGLRATAMAAICCPQTLGVRGDT